MFTVEALYDALVNLTPIRRFLLAYSGGLDSHVLLHSLVQLRKIHPEISLRAVYIHHGLYLQEDNWVKCCEKICADWGVDYQSQQISLAFHKNKNQSPEELARTKRYDALKNILQENEALLTGHHQNDQAETLLLQLFRGAGPKGMAAMGGSSNFAHTQLIRPLLNFTRSNLQNYAETYGLTWIEDSSNQGVKFDRNFIRHQILPLIQKRWPSVLTTLTRSARHCFDAAVLLAQMGDSELLNLQGSVPCTLAIQNLRLLDPRKQSLVIRRWLEHLHLPAPSEAKLMQVINTVLLCRSDAVPKVHWQGVEMRRYRDNLYAISPLIPINPLLTIVWDLRANLELPHNLGTLFSQECQKLPLYKKDQPVMVKFRQGGEHCQPMGSKTRRSLKNLFQEWGVPPWERERIPLVCQAKEIIYIPGYCICAHL